MVTTLHHGSDAHYVRRRPNNISPLSLPKKSTKPAKPLMRATALCKSQKRHGHPAFIISSRYSASKWRLELRVILKRNPNNCHHFHENGCKGLKNVYGFASPDLMPFPTSFMQLHNIYYLTLSFLLKLDFYLSQCVC